MLRIVSVVAMILLVCAGCCCAGAKPTQSPAEHPEPPVGFVSLFNGTNLDGWVVMGKTEGWTVQDGAIRSEGGKGGDWLRSAKQYDDFILVLEWKVSPGGNSGVFVRCTEQGYPWETGHEIQISNERPPRDNMHCTGTLYGTVAVNPRPDETPNRWRRYEIACIGKKIAIKVDNVQCVEADMDEVPAIRDKPLRGHIGLQDSHTGPGGVIEYRNIFIKEM